MKLFNFHVSKREFYYKPNGAAFIFLFLIPLAVTIFSFDAKANNLSATEASVCIDCVVESLKPNFVSNSQFEDFKLIPATIISKDPSGQTFIDPREVIDRNNPEYSQLNAIGLLTVAGVSDDSPSQGGGTLSLPSQDGKKLANIGTGFLINDCLVMTNSHVVNDNMPKGKLKNRTITFAAGQSSDPNQKFNSSASGTVIAEGNFSGGTDIQNDWAIIKLNKPLGKKLGSIDPLLLPAVQVAKLPVSTASFYIDKTDGKSLWGQKKCNVIAEDSQNTNAWLTDCPVLPGGSGSPVFVQNPENKKIFVLGLMQGSNNAQDKLVNKLDYHNANRMIPLSKALSPEDLKKIESANSCDAVST